MSDAWFLGDEALHTPREDGDERNRNEGDEVLLRALDDDVQPPIAAEPGERSLNHPANPGRDEPSIAAASNGLDADAERLTDFGRPLAPAAEVAKRRTFGAIVGKPAQDRHDPFGVVPVRRRDLDRQRDAVLVDRPWILTPRIVVPPSMPRSRPFGAERQDRLSITTALGSGASPHARGQRRRRRSS